MKKINFLSTNKRMLEYTTVFDDTFIIYEFFVSYKVYIMKY